MKTLILAACLFLALLMQGCYAYIEPVGGYYQREGYWYYHDRDGREHRDHHHHDHEEHDEDHH